MKICLITFEYPPMLGGIAVASRRISNYLKKLGHEVHIFTVGDMRNNVYTNDAISLKTSEDNGIVIHRMTPYSGTLTRVPPQEIQNATHFLEVLHKKYHFDVFHGIRINPCGYLAVNCAKRFSKRSIVSVRGNDIGRDIYDTELYHRIKHVFDNADQITFVNAYLKDIAGLHFNISDKSHVIYNSIRLEDFDERDIGSPLERHKDHFLVGFTGQVRRKKGFCYLLDAFKEFSKEKKTRLVIIGDFIPDEKESYLKMIKGFEDKILVTGRVPHEKILDYIKELDVFVLPSLSEGCSNALLEAMYAERACLATNKGDMDLILKDSGIIVDAHSSDEILDALNVLYEKPQLRKKLGKAAKQKILSEFLEKNEIDKWRLLYQGLEQNMPSMTTASSEKIGKLRYVEYLNNIRKGTINIAPLEVEIELSFNCNLHCKMCDKQKLIKARQEHDEAFFDKFDIMDCKEKWQEYYYDRAEVMSLNNVKSILDQLKDAGVNSILFTGGEPLIHPEIDRIITYAAELGLNVSVITNGTQVDAAIAKTLITSKARLYISLDGATKETHDNIRGVEGAFDKVMHSIKLFNKIDKTFALGLRFVVLQENIDEISEFFELAKDIGIDDFSFELVSGEFFDYIKKDDFIRLKNVLRNVTEKYGYDYAKEKVYWIDNVLNDAISPESLSQGKPQRDLFINAPQICFFCGNSCLINAYGDVYPCGYTINPSNNLGNVIKEDFKNIWNGEKYNLFRQKTAPVDLSNNKFYSCGDCELHQSFKKIRQGIKNVLLINPSYQPHWSRCEPLGLMQLAAQLEKADFKVRILDLNVDEYTDNDITMLIEDFAPVLIGFTATSRQVSGAYELANKVKKDYPYINIVYGGVHPSIMIEECFDTGCADFVICGEADESILKLAAYIMFESRDAAEIPNLAYKKDGVLIHNKKSCDVDIDQLEIPAYHLVELDKYNTNIHVKPFDKEQAVHVMSSRGCPFNCSFCSVPKIYDRRVKYCSVEYIINYLKFLKYELGINNVHFHDDVFLLDHGRVTALCQMLTAMKLDMRWICLASVQEIVASESLLALMHQAGCVGIEFGVESGDVNVLNKMGKRQDIETIKKANRLLKKNNIQPLYLMISYYLGENIDSAFKSAKLLYEMIKDKELVQEKIPKYEQHAYIMGHLARSSPGTEFYDIAKTEGVVFAETWTDHFEETVGFLPNSLLYDCPKTNDVEPREFVTRIINSNIKNYVEKTFYAPASVGRLFRQDHKQYVQLLHNVYKYCKGGNRVKDIIESSHKRFDYSYEMVIHALSMLSILRLIKSSNRYIDYKESIRKDGHLNCVPKDVELEITYQCNLTCKMCDVRRISTSCNTQVFEKYANLDPVNDFKRVYYNRKEIMDLHTVIKLFDEFKEIGIRSVALSGGEPFVHPEIDNIIDYANKIGLSGSVFTNGVLINARRADALMKHNWKVSVSIDGSNSKIHDSIRNADSVFDRAMDAVKKLKQMKLKYNKGKIEFHCTVQKENADNIMDFYDFADRMEIDDFDFDLITSEFPGRQDQESYNNIFKQLQMIKKRYPDYKKHIPWADDFLNKDILEEDVINCKPRMNLFQKEPVTCYYCCDSVNINPYGDIFPCCYTFNPSSIMGNIQEISFKEILHGAKFDDFRKGLSPVTFNDRKYESCKYCALHHIFKRIERRYN